MVTGSPNHISDFIIIGSGTAGSVLAARLSEDPALTICLLEAGGSATDPRIADPLAWPALQGSAIDWGYATLPQRHTAERIHAWPRGRVLGGSSAINAMAHVRGHPADFDAWAGRAAAAGAMPICCLISSAARPPISRPRPITAPRGRFI